MRWAISAAFVFFPISAVAQSTGSGQALLAKTRALYDTPFLRGLINFDCAVQFDFVKHIEDSFGVVPPNASSLVAALHGISYRVFVDNSGAVASVEGKLPDLSGIPNAALLEQTNRQIIQAAIDQWIPFAFGEILPVGPTKAHFEKVPEGYTITMDGPGVAGSLRTDAQLRLIGGTMEKPQHIEFVSKFVDGPNGLLLAANTTNAADSGDAEFHFTYHAVDSYQLPERITVKSVQGLRWQFTLTDCKAQHGIVVKVKNLPIVPK